MSRAKLPEGYIVPWWAVRPPKFVLRDGEPTPMFTVASFARAIGRNSSWIDLMERTGVLPKPIVLIRKSGYTVRLYSESLIWSAHDFAVGHGVFEGHHASAEFLTALASICRRHGRRPRPATV